MTSRPNGGYLRAFGLAPVGVLLVVGACQVDRPSLTDASPANDPLETVTQPDAVTGPIELRVRTDGSAVAGLLRDRETGEPIPGAQVVVDGLGIGGLSNVQGRFLLVSVPSGTHTLVVHHDDYAPDVRVAVTVEGEAAAAEPRGEFVPRISPSGPAITGSVVDPGTGAAVPSAQVYVEELDIGSLTNVEGRFLLLGVPSGTHTLTVEHDRLGTFRIEVEVGEEGTTNLGEISPERR